MYFQTHSTELLAKMLASGIDKVSQLSGELNHILIDVQNIRQELARRAMTQDICTSLRKSLPDIVASHPQYRQATPEEAPTLWEYQTITPEEAKQMLNEPEAERHEEILVTGPVAAWGRIQYKLPRTSALHQHISKEMTRQRREVDECNYVVVCFKIAFSKDDFEQMKQLLGLTWESLAEVMDVREMEPVFYPAHHSDSLRYEKIKDDPRLEALRDRTIKVDVPFMEEWLKEQPKPEDKPYIANPFDVYRNKLS